MKTLLVAALVLVPCWALADSATNAPAAIPAPAPAPAPTPANPLAGLTPAQKTQGEQILAGEAKQKKAIEENKKLAPVQQQVLLSDLQRNTQMQIQALKLSAPVKH